jgi:hypothetical protein
MSIFYAIGHLIELVGNMAKPPPAESSSSDANYGSGGGGGANKEVTCPPPPPKSSTQTSNTNSGEDETDMGMEDLLPLGDLNIGGEEEEGENEPGKTFIEILFSFVLDPLTAIIKGIIKMVELAIITVNIAMHLGKCAKWFVIYVFCTLVYIPISMIFALLNLSTLEKKIWRTLYVIDAALFCVIEKVRGQGFHIAKFSDDIRSVCFLENVKPTDCSSKTKSKKKKSKSINLSKLLGSQLFLFVVILFVCLIFFWAGSPNRSDAPISFYVLFGIIVLTIIVFIISIITDYILYLFIVLIIPIVIFIFSFLFGFMPTIFFSKFYSEEGGPKKEKYSFSILYNLSKYLYFFVLFLNGIYKWAMGYINPLPKFMKYIIASVCVFVTFMIIMIIIAISLQGAYSSPIPPTATS